MRILSVLVAIALATSACATTQEKIAAAGAACKGVGKTALENSACNDANERQIFEGTELESAYHVWNGKRTTLAQQFDDKKINAEQFKAGIAVAGSEFKQRIRAYEVRRAQRAKEAERNTQEALKLFATGVGAYYEAKGESARATLEALKETENSKVDRRPGGFLKSETVSGLNRICFYDSVRGIASITVASHELCPLSLD